MAPSIPTPATPDPGVTAPSRIPSRLQRILVVDEDHRVRDSLADLIGLADGVEVVGTTSQPAETLAAIERLRPSVVVIDPYLPDLEDGLAFIRSLRANGPRALRIVATCRDGGIGEVALAAGADVVVDRCADAVVFQAAVLAAAHPRPAERSADGPAGGWR
jgi:DNA-binding NarL/FixJ family response regulator